MKDDILTLETLLQFIAQEEIRLQRKYGLEAADRQWQLSHALKLTEEVGELAEQVLASQAIQRGDKAKQFDNEALGQEVADVLITALLVAESFNVDVAAVLKTKIAKIEARYGHLE